MVEGATVLDQTIDIRNEAEAAQAAVKGNVLIIFGLLAFPWIAVFEPLSNIMARTGDYNVSWEEGGIALAVMGDFLAIPVYRWLTALGPVSVSMRQDVLVFEYSSGKCRSWDLDKLKQVRIFTVTDSSNRYLTFSRGQVSAEIATGQRSRSSVAVPAIRKGLFFGEYPISNHAALAIRKRLLNDGWKVRGDSRTGADTGNTYRTYILTR